MANAELVRSDSLTSQKIPNRWPKKLQPLSISRAFSTNLDLILRKLPWKFTRTTLILSLVVNIIFRITKVTTTSKMSSFPAKSSSWSNSQTKIGITLLPSTVKPKVNWNYLSNLEGLWSMPPVRNSKDMLAKKTTILSKRIMTSPSKDTITPSDQQSSSSNLLSLRRFIGLLILRIFTFSWSMWLRVPTINRSTQKAWKIQLEFLASIQQKRLKMRRGSTMKRRTLDISNLIVWTWKTQPRINWKLKFWSIRISTRKINLLRFIRPKMKTWHPKKFLAILPWCW